MSNSRHAIESRVYAEDPLRNFLPSIGPLNSYTEPPLLNHNGNIVRIDTGTFPLLYPPSAFLSLFSLLTRHFPVCVTCRSVRRRSHLNVLRSNDC
jgi:pyruvate carboxylase